MPDKDPDSPEEPARGCETNGGKDSSRLRMSLILERGVNGIVCVIYFDVLNILGSKKRCFILMARNKEILHGHPPPL